MLPFHFPFSAEAGDVSVRICNILIGNLVPRGMCTVYHRSGQLCVLKSPSRCMMGGHLVRDIGLAASLTSGAEQWRVAGRARAGRVRGKAQCSADGEAGQNRCGATGREASNEQPDCLKNAHPWTSIAEPNSRIVRPMRLGGDRRRRAEAYSIAWSDGLTPFLYLRKPNGRGLY